MAFGFSFRLCIVTLNGVQSVTGEQIAPNSTVHFTSWKLASGWVTREFYLNVDTNNAGGAVADLQADAKYPDSPNISDVAKGFRINNDITGNNYGARICAFFVPPTSGVYEFFMYNDDVAQLSLSSDQSAANLTMLIDSPVIQGVFDAAVMGTSPTLAAQAEVPSRSVVSAKHWLGFAGRCRAAPRHHSRVNQHTGNIHPSD